MRAPTICGTPAFENWIFAEIDRRLVGYDSPLLRAAISEGHAARRLARLIDRSDETSPVPSRSPAYDDRPSALDEMLRDLFLGIASRSLASTGRADDFRDPPGLSRREVETALKATSGAKADGVLDLTQPITSRLAVMAAAHVARRSRGQSHHQAAPQPSSSRSAASPKLELPRAIPTVDFRLAAPDSDGHGHIDVGHLTIADPRGPLSLPLLVDYQVAGSLRLGDYDALVVTDCLSVGDITYAHAVYVRHTGADGPCLVVAAESNILLQNARAEESATKPLFLGVFFFGGRQNLGASLSIRELPGFLEVATKWWRPR